MLTFRVTKVTSKGSDVVVELSAGSIRFSKKTLGKVKIKPGDEIEVDLNPEGITALAQGAEVSGSFKGKVSKASAPVAAGESVKAPRQKDF